jgi:integrase/recombinase XerC
MNEGIITSEKYLSDQEVDRLCLLLAEKAARGETSGDHIAVRDWTIIDTALSTGLKVSEIANLNVGDIELNSEKAVLSIRDANGRSKRKVELKRNFAIHLMRYLRWERNRGVDISPERPLFRSEKGGRMTTRAIQRRFKKWASDAGLDSSYTIHSCRHTYAMKLLRSGEHDLSYVQKQMGYQSRQSALEYSRVDTR